MDLRADSKSDLRAESMSDLPFVNYDEVDFSKISYTKRQGEVKDNTTNNKVIFFNFMMNYCGKRFNVKFPELEVPGGIRKSDYGSGNRDNYFVSFKISKTDEKIKEFFDTLVTHIIDYLYENRTSCKYINSKITGQDKQNALATLRSFIRYPYYYPKDKVTGEIQNGGDYFFFQCQMYNDAKSRLQLPNFEPFSIASLLAKPLTMVPFVCFNKIFVNSNMGTIKSFLNNGLVVDIRDNGTYIDPSRIKDLLMQDPDIREKTAKLMNKLPRIMSEPAPTSNDGLSTRIDDLDINVGDGD